MSLTQIALIVCICLVGVISVSTNIYLLSKKNNKVDFKQLDFFKLIIIFFSVLPFYLYISLSFILAFLDKNVNETVTVAIITAVVAPVITYGFKSYMEKNSTNKYKTDENGVPYEVAYREVYEQIIENDINDKNNYKDENGAVG